MPTRVNYVLMSDTLGADSLVCVISTHVDDASGRKMKALMLFTGSGPIVILTSHDSATDPVLLEKLRAKGIERFLAYELPLDLARQRYGGHFITVVNDLHETDDLRVLDYNGERAFGLFRLDELQDSIIYDPRSAKAA